MASPFDVCLDSYKYLFSPDLLRDRVAFVTGGGSGIGFTICEIFMRHGCKVAIGSRNLSKLEVASNRLQKATGGTCHVIQMDVRKPKDIERAIDSTLSKFGRIDILVNNAAGNFLSPITGLSFNAYKTVLEIDAIGTFNTSKIVYEKYFHDHGGVIINISATLYYKGDILQAHAGSAKAAIDALTKHMAVEWGPNKVRVAGVAPGPIEDTEGMRRLGGKNTKDKMEYTKLIPLQRTGQKVEVAHAVLFLASDAGSFITGETMVADGGSWLASYKPVLFSKM